MEHRRVFDQEIAELKEMILTMGKLVQKLIINSVNAFRDADIAAAKAVIEEDEKVDQLELDIDEKSIQMIALRQPEASDLRFVMTGIRIATDLERIGDLAEDIGQRTLDLNGKPSLAAFAGIPAMAKLAEEELTIVLDAFINRDANTARQVWAKEKAVDKLRNSVCHELSEDMTKNGALVPTAMPLMLVARHLERISDHVTNIAEDIIYMTEGKVVKHSGLKHELR